MADNTAMSGLEWLSRSRARLDEAEQIVAAESKAAGELRQQIQRLDTLVHGEQRSLGTAEATLRTAEARRFEAESWLQVVTDSPAESDARAAVDAAAAAHAQARSRVETLKGSLAAAVGRRDREVPPLTEQLASHQARITDAERQVAGYEKLVALARRRADIERNHDATVEIVGAFVAYLDALEKWRATPGAIEVHQHGVNLPRLLASHEYTATNIVAILRDDGTQGAVPLLRVRRYLTDYLTAAEEHYARQVAQVKMPS